MGPGIARLTKTHAWRAWDHYSEARGDRLAAAATYAGFLALFPLIAVSAAVAAAFLTNSQVHRIEKKVGEQFAFLSDQLDLESLVRNAGTVGVIGAVLLLFSGLGWVDTMRGSIRGVWRVEDAEENVFARKGKDLAVLLGLGAVLCVSVGASALTTALIGHLADWLGLNHHGAGVVLLRVLGTCVAIAADFLLVVYLLRWLPGLHPGRRSLVQAGLIGAVGFELLKLLLSGYLGSVAGKSMYGAFGTPVAVLLWMNFMMRLLLLCAAWTATAKERRRHDEREVECVSPDELEGRTERDGSPGRGEGARAAREAHGTEAASGTHGDHVNAEKVNGSRGRVRGHRAARAS
ncbi:membrane protein [Wenjunlia tyrosinilytica]|uniref:Membrane protein n=1 Tax=Wenjunlia tyrosinilytica TaxID=1544741 RepID=A0A918DU45_9ACTN|nr:membrane protein [Wenjunlia tyrosinilytica]